MIGQLCLDAHLSKRDNLYTPYNPEGIQECSTFNFIVIYNYLMELLKYELSTIFTIYGIYQCIFSLESFISLSEASVLIT